MRTTFRTDELPPGEIDWERWVYEIEDGDALPLTNVAKDADGMTTLSFLEEREIVDCDACGGTGSPALGLRCGACRGSGRTTRATGRLLRLQGEGRREAST